ncbi:uncharacterized protein FTOL_09973 [Fusarium torulosum]|uniref:Protein kinase domain-containing protein n=1 Tax=Fusarium torulosum TaxID=33205 RepID=A0AAE8MFJ7_9HYPO|nr:uncharacterized protein FTOL_09973 [Fusarium torulosum]
MEVAGIALASASAAHELFQIGVRIYYRIKDKQKLTLVLREFQMFDLTDERDRLRLEIQRAQTALKSPTVEKEHKNRLEQRWKRIVELLFEIDCHIDTMIANPSLMATRARHKARDELLHLGGTMAISTALRDFRDDISVICEVDKNDSPLYLSFNAFQPLDTANRVYGPSNNSFFGRGKLTDPVDGVSNTPQWFLFESRPYDQQSPQMRDAIKQNVQILAQKLQKAQENRGIIKLIGFTEHFEANSFQLVFACPFEGQYPPSLQTYLKTYRTKPSLNFRINLCSQLATAVLQTQTLGLVHKNITPENILLLPPVPEVDTQGRNIPKLFLTGWQYARQIERGVTNLKGEITIRRKIYQHPERQIPEAEKEYSMAHDAYSLGVCMIEVLTWEALLITTTSPTMSQNFITSYKSLGFPEDALEPYTKYPDQIKETLCSLCNRLIPVVAGDKMARLVKDFLTCLDDREHDQNEAQQYFPSQDRDKRQAGIHFIDTTLRALRDIQSAI